MLERPRSALKRLTGSGPAPSIAFLIDHLEDSRYHWQVLRGAMNAAYDRGANLVCFVGGVLAPPGSPNDSNWVFDLARPQNVDAVVMLSGSLGNVVGSEGLRDYAKRFQPMPICSIALPLEGMSSVCVDNEGGMRAAVEHLVRAHGLQRIAFVRGPAANDEAELRLRVYREVLEQNQIPYNPDLVVPGDFTAPAGREAISTLFDDRKLTLPEVAGIVAANDAMALGAIEELRTRGIRVPDQIAVVGFDNVEESRFTLPPLTTVGQPLLDQGREAVRIVLEQLRDKSGPQQALRHTELVTRRSCGCLQGAVGDRKSSSPPGPGLGFDAALLRRRHHILADVARAARGELGAAGTGWDTRLLNAAAEQIRGDRSDAFVFAYDDLLRRLLAAGADPAICNDVVSALRSRLVRCVGDAKQRMRTEDMFHEARLMTTQAVERIHVTRQMRVWSEARSLLQVGASIGSSRGLDELSRAVRESLPRVGIPRCFIARLVTTSTGEPAARFVLAEKPDARKSDPALAATYPLGDFLRLGVLPGTDEHTFAVFPIRFGTGERGLVVLEIAGHLEGYGYETLRQVFASALGRM